MSTGTGKGVIGQAVKRKEDKRLLIGKGIFVDDIVLPEMLFASFVRSPYAHARIKGIDASGAMKLPGVVSVVTGEEFASFIKPLEAHSLLDTSAAESLKDYGIAVKKAIYHGEPVAAVVAVDKYVAKDAIGLVEVSYDPLHPVLDPEESMDDKAVRVQDGTPSNVVWHRIFSYGDLDKAFSGADLVVKSRLYFHRVMTAPLEPYAVIASFDKGGGILTINSNSSHPGRDVFLVARSLNMSPNRVRMICQDNGGSFGNKNNMYPYIMLVGYLAMKTGRPVKWIMERNEHLLASSHGNEMIYYGEMAFKNDGTILGMKARMIADEGSELRSEPRGATNWIRQLTSVYRFRNIQMDINCVLTNKCPTASMRSYGKQQHSFLIESLIEKAARQLTMDPAKIRFKNFILPKEMPYKNPTGGVYDGGDYPACLKRTLKMVGYEAWRERQRKLREEGKLIGIGIAMAMEAYGGNKSQMALWRKGLKSSGDTGSAMIKIDAEGHVSASVDSMSMGHSHETTTAQIIAEILTLSPDDIDVFPGFDSWITAYGERGSGSYGSRFGIVHHGAILGAAQKMREKILRHGAFMLGIPVKKVDLVQGRVRVKGTKKSVGLKEVGFNAWMNTGVLPKNLEAGLVAHHVYNAPLKPLEAPELGRGNFSLTYSYGAAVAVVEIDRETGMTSLLKFVCLEDPGKCINPMVCEGQVHGQIGHQMSAALFERLIYDEDGRLLTSTFKDYLAPTAADLPKLETAIMETPALFTPLGTRGMAEGGGAPLVAVVNAVRDALSPLGIELENSYIEPEDILKRIRGSSHR